MTGRTNVGDRVIYRAFGNEHRVGTITESLDEIKNGEPGFLMDTDDGCSVWGYDSQIIAINTEARPR